MNEPNGVNSDADSREIIGGSPPDYIEGVREILSPNSLEAEENARNLREFVKDELELRPMKGRFRLSRLINWGGQGFVYGGSDAKMGGRPIAYKTVRPDGEKNRRAISHLEREAEITASLQHPNIIPVYDYDRNARGIPYFAMRPVAGHSMKQAIHLASQDRRHSFDNDTAPLIRALVAACHAVDYAHSQDILHRDLKPSNIMLGLFGEVVVIDWGLALRTNVADDRSTKEAL
ncbi:protein kinase [Singulisphaera sp. Ch08]|uniref:Protein kinase n=1 Tax=Singulisphaera sp. Ch08 TaxID=3120278 RepID=A0AAU7C9F5_9BACT